MIFLLLFIFAHAAADVLPADVSFLVADVKYSEAQGVKICEVQQCSISLFKGYDSLYQGKGLIPEYFCNVMADFNHRFWFISNDLSFVEMQKKFLEQGWIEGQSFKALMRDKLLNKIGKTAPADPSSLTDYQGFVYMRLDDRKDYEKFHQNYPGLLLIDYANRDYLFDKYKMSTLFTHHPELIQAKPKWGLYRKKYKAGLADKIIQEIGSPMLVIKPRAAWEGYGIIMVEQENLDAVLRKVFSNPSDLAGDADPGYSYWAHDPFDTFLVEEFCASDPISVPQLDNRLYNCTLRIPFILIYHQNRLQLHYLGMYWMAPKLPIDAEGTWNEKSKAYPFSKGPAHFCPTDPATQAKVKKLLARPFLLMYKRMLGFDVENLEEGIEDAIVIL